MGMSANLNASIKLEYQDFDSVAQFQELLAFEDEDSDGFLLSYANSEMLNIDVDGIYLSSIYLGSWSSCTANEMLEYCHWLISKANQLEQQFPGLKATAYFNHCFW